MELPKHPLTHNQSIFLSNLRTFMNEPLYFYGSILRGDYLPGLSDIDVLLFSDDDTNDSKKLVRYFKHLRSKEQDDNVHIKLSRFVYHSKEIKRIISGYKVMYQDLEKAIPIEITIYNKEHKNLILHEQQKKADLSFWVIWFLIIFKTLAYKYRVISEDIFKVVKEKLFIWVSGIEGTFIMF
jgi:predicted nucleotidyltransferase